jgi:hypothetical protein
MGCAPGLSENSFDLLGLVWEEEAGVWCSRKVLDRIRGCGLVFTFSKF